MGVPLIATLGTEAFQPYGFDAGHGAAIAFFERHGHRVDHGPMRSISVTDPSQVRPTHLLCALCQGRGGSHRGHGTPELMVSMGGNE